MKEIAFIFDVDGLMVDTEPLSRRAWDDVLGFYGHALEEEVYLGIIGYRIQETAGYLQRFYGLSEEPAELIRRKQAAYDEILDRGLDPMPGLEALVSALEQRQIRWGVATSSPHEHAEKVLQLLGLRSHCQAVAGGDEVALGKPAPDIYLLAAARLGVASRRCLALEDSAPGCQAALSAGLLTVAVPNGDTQMDLLPAVDYTFSSLAAVAGNLDFLLAKLQAR